MSPEEKESFNLGEVNIVRSCAIIARTWGFTDLAQRLDALEEMLLAPICTTSFPPLDDTEG